MSKSITANIDRPIPFTVTDPDAPIPYRIRVSTLSPETREYIVPRHDVPTFSVPPEAPSEPQLQVA